MAANNYDCYRFAFFSCLSLFLLIWNDTLEIMVGCRSCTYPRIHLFMMPTLKITVGQPSSTYPSFRTEKNSHTCVGLLGPHCRKWWGAVGTSNRAGAYAFTSEPQLSSPRRRFQTGQTPEKLASMFRLLGPCLETLQRKWHTWKTPWPCFATATMKESKKKKNRFSGLSLPGSLGAWDWWSGRGNTSVGQTHETTDA